MSPTDPGDRALAELAQVLGMVTAAQVAAAVAEQRPGEELGGVLARLGHLGPAELMTLQERLGRAPAEPDAFDPGAETHDQLEKPGPVPETEAWKEVLPLPTQAQRTEGWKEVLPLPGQEPPAAEGAPVDPPAATPNKDPKIRLVNPAFAPTVIQVPVVGRDGPVTRLSEDAEDFVETTAPGLGAAPGVGATPTREGAEEDEDEIETIAPTSLAELAATPSPAPEAQEENEDEIETIAPTSAAELAPRKPASDLPQEELAETLPPTAAIPAVVATPEEPKAPAAAPGSAAAEASAPSSDAVRASFAARLAGWLLLLLVLILPLDTAWAGWGDPLGLGWPATAAAGLALTLGLICAVQGRAAVGAGLVLALYSVVIVGAALTHAPGAARVTSLGLEPAPLVSVLALLHAGGIALAGGLLLRGRTALQVAWVVPVAALALGLGYAAVKGAQPFAVLPDLPWAVHPATVLLLYVFPFAALVGLSVGAVRALRRAEQRSLVRDAGFHASLLLWVPAAALLGAQAGDRLPSRTWPGVATVLEALPRVQRAVFTPPKSPTGAVGGLPILAPGPPPSRSTTLRPPPTPKTQTKPKPKPTPRPKPTATATPPKAAAPPPRVRPPMPIAKVEALSGEALGRLLARRWDVLASHAGGRVLAQSDGGDSVIRLLSPGVGWITRAGRYGILGVREGVKRTVDTLVLAVGKRHRPTRIGLYRATATTTRLEDAEPLADVELPASGSAFVWKLDAPLEIEGLAVEVVAGGPGRIDLGRVMALHVPNAAESAMPRRPEEAILLDLGGASLGGRVLQAPAKRQAVGSHVVAYRFDGRRRESITIGFPAATTLERVVVAPGSGGPDLSSSLGEVELLAGAGTEADGGPFRRLGIYTVPWDRDPRVIRFAPTSAKALRVVPLASRQGTIVLIPRPQVLPASGAALDLPPLDLAAYAHGGCVARFSSQAKGRVFDLIDQNPASGWSSAGPAPHDLTFGFAEGQGALVGAVELEVPTAEGCPRQVKLSVTGGSVLSTFREVAFTALPQRTGVHRIVLDPPVAARYVRVRVLAGYSGRVRFSAVRVLEGRRPGYRSRLLGGGVRLAAATGGGDKAWPQPADGQEQEPNDRAAPNPLALGKTVEGAIVPKGERDAFRLDLSRAKGRLLQVRLSGRPYLRTSLTAWAGGRVLKQFDPSAVRARETRFTWKVDQPELDLEVTEPTSSVVLVYDMSGSLSPQDAARMRQALMTWVQQVEPSEQVAILRFQGLGRGAVHVDANFTSDRDALRASLAAERVPKGGTPFYDAIGKAVEMLEQRKGNRAIVVLTDGSDSTSRGLSLPRLWERLDAVGVRLHTIGLGGALPQLNPVVGMTGTRLLSTLAEATGGETFQARTNQELARVYATIAEVLRRPTRYRLRAEVSSATGQLRFVQLREKLQRLRAPPNVGFVLDCSRSMNKALKGRGGLKRMEAAKQAFVSSLAALPDGARVALRAYGHRRKSSCKDTELLYPLGPLDRKRLGGIVQGLKATGMTPIARSLEQVPLDLAAAKGERVVVLISDGRESCEGDPVRVAKRLRKSGFDVRIHVVGFALEGSYTARKQLKGIADATGGRFLEAGDVGALRRALTRVLEVGYTVLDSAGAPVARGLVSEGPKAMPVGTFQVRLESTPPYRIPQVEIRPDRITTVRLTKEGKSLAYEVRIGR